MQRNKIALTEEIVKYIFPGSEPTIAPGEDGYIIYDFKMMYPAKLGIFIPIEVDRSNYSSVFPKPFEAYFLDLDKQAEYLSRFLEVDIKPTLPNIGVQFVPGKVLQRNENNYTIFRFDELIAPIQKTDLLCRVKYNNLSGDNSLKLLNIDPKFKAGAYTVTGIQYQYWICPNRYLFCIDNEFLAAVFTLADSYRVRKGPF